MTVEMPQNETEKGIPQLSSDEWNKFCTVGNMNDPELLNWMQEKHISFDQGDIEIELDGKVVKMVTDKDDFGTIVKDDSLPPPPVERFNVAS